MCVYPCCSRASQRGIIRAHPARMVAKMTDENGKSLTLSREDSYELVWSKPMAGPAKDFGISDVALAKRVQASARSSAGGGYWARVDAGQSPYRPKLLRRCCSSRSAKRRQPLARSFHSAAVNFFMLRDASAAAGVPSKPGARVLYSRITPAARSRRHTTSYFVDIGITRWIARQSAATRAWQIPPGWPPARSRGKPMKCRIIWMAGFSRSARPRNVRAGPNGAGYCTAIAMRLTNR